QARIVCAPEVALAALKASSSLGWQLVAARLGAALGSVQLAAAASSHLSATKQSSCGANRSRSFHTKKAWSTTALVAADGVDASRIGVTVVQAKRALVNIPAVVNANKKREV